jgi:hypothetical protein
MLVSSSCSSSETERTGLLPVRKGGMTFNAGVIYLAAATKKRELDSFL